jgi:hypothetical protein
MQDFATSSARSAVDGIDAARFVSVVRWTDPLSVSGTVREVLARGEQGHLLVLDRIGELRDREGPASAQPHVCCGLRSDGGA